MYYLQELLNDYPILFLAQTAFTIWMLVDAYRRGAEFFWYWIMLFVPVAGPWVYFFVVKGPTVSWKWPPWERKTPLAELEFRVRQTPTFAHQVALGQRLMELGRFEEAVPPLLEAHKREPEHSPVRHSLARCHFEMGNPAEALPLVALIVQKEPRWEDYAAWRLLVEVQDELNRGDDALETARQLVKLSPRMEHKVLLAEQLVRSDQPGEARILLENALQEQHYTTGPARRLNRKWVKEAQRLLRTLTPK